jgi:hypothetical protein
MKPSTVRLAGVHAPGLPDTDRVRTNGGDPLSPEKETAVPAGPRNGGTKADGIEAQVKPRYGQCRKAGPVARVRLIPTWNDDQHLTGWISVGEAAANVLDEIGGAS